MKILSFSLAYGFHGGLESTLREINPRLVENGVNLTNIYLLRDHDDFPSLAGTNISLNKKGKSSYYKPWTHYEALGKILKHIDDVDIVHIQEPRFPQSPLIALAARSRGKKVVCTYHGESKVLSSVKSYVQQSVLKMTSKLCHVNIGISQDTTKKMGPDALNLGYVVDTKFFSETSQNTGFCWPSGQFILYPARFVPGKNQKFLVENSDRLSDMEVVLMGNPVDHNYFTYLQNMAGPNVHIYHAQNRIILREGYSRCAAVAFPSMWEGFGKIGIEGNLQGKPVIGFNVPGIRETINHGVNGFKVALGDAFQFVRAIEKRKDILPDDCVSWALQFSIDSYVDRLMNIYENLLK